jgi:hypothetical protein
MSLSLVQSMWRAARLDGSLYQEIAASRTARAQAPVVISLAVLASAIGGASGALNRPAEGLALAALSSGANTLVTWLLISHILCFVGIVVLRARIGYVGALQALAFSYAPGVLDVFRSVPIVGIVALTVTAFWSLAALYVAVRRGFELGHWKTVAAVAVSLVSYAYIRVQLRFMTGI